MTNLPPPIDYTYYLSGPIAGNEEVNISRFHEAAAELRNRGYTILSPVEIHSDEDLKVRHPWDWYMRRDIVEMLRDGVRGIILLPGWEFSRGAKLELQVAVALQFHVTSYADCLRRQIVPPLLQGD